MAISPHNHDEDLTLVKACKRELPYITTSFEELVRKHEPTVLNTCRYLLCNREDSEEVAQDVFLRIFHHLKKFDERSTFRTWLYRIVRNCCYTQMEKQQRLLNFNKSLLNWESSVEEYKNDNPFGFQMNEALAKLSSDESEIITLRFISDLSMKEIAETIGIQLSAAKMRFYRALEKLKKEFR